MEQACAEADAAGLDAATVSRGQAHARWALRHQAKGKLLEAIRSGDFEQIEQECEESEAVGVDAAMIYAARAKLKLLKAMQGDDAGQLEKACEEAEAAGVDAVTISRGRKLSQDMRLDVGLQAG